MNENNYESNRLPIVAILLGGSFLAVLNQTLLVTPMPLIMSEFRLTENIAQWVTTVFLLVNGIMIPITAFLMERFKSRHLFMMAMAIFIVGTVISAIPANFTLLMLGRIVQAVGAGVLIPLMMTVFMLIYPLNKRGYAMGMAGLVISFAPAIGPSFSGWVIDFLPWRAVFYVVLPLAIIDLVLAYFFMKNVVPQTKPKVDVLSIILSSFGFGGLLFGFSIIGEYGWTDPLVLTVLLVGGISLPLFIIRQFKLKEPILEFRVFSYRTFTITTIIGMVAFMSIIAAEMILPIYMQTMANFSAFESGLMILPGALLMGIASPIVGKIFDKYGGKKLIIIGLIITVITTFMYTRLTAETSFLYITVIFAIRMIGISMAMMPSTTAGLNVLPKRLIAHGTAMSNTMRQVAASIGTAVLITIMTVAALEPINAYDVSALVHGVNISFYVATGISLIALILAFFINEKREDI